MCKCKSINKIRGFWWSTFYMWMCCRFYVKYFFLSELCSFSLYFRSCRLCIGFIWVIVFKYFIFILVSIKVTFSLSFLSFPFPFLPIFLYYYFLFLFFLFFFSISFSFITNIIITRGILSLLPSASTSSFPGLLANHKKN